MPKLASLGPINRRPKTIMGKHLLPRLITVWSSEGDILLCPVTIHILSRGERINSEGDILLFSK